MLYDHKPSQGKNHDARVIFSSRSIGRLLRPTVTGHHAIESGTAGLGDEVLMIIIKPDLLSRSPTDRAKRLRAHELRERVRGVEIVEGLDGSERPRAL